MAWQDKDPNETLEYSVDWTESLGGDTVAASSWVVPAGVTEVSRTFTDTETTIWLSGGTAGERYAFLNTITTAAGRVIEAAASLYVKDTAVSVPSVLDVTIGGAASDSYATLQEAIDYAAKVGAAFAGTVAEQEAALRRAAMWLDGKYGDRYPGAKVGGRTQALQWPRENAQDAGGETVDFETIPAEIKQAQMQAAIRELASPNSLAPDVTPGANKVLNKVGELGWKVIGSGGRDAQKPVVSVVDDILAPLIGGASNRLLRA